MDEIRLSWRRLTKHPAATVASIVTLAFSIGAAAAAWSLLSALLLNPLPVRDADRLVVVGTPHQRLAGALNETFDYLAYPEIRDSGAFERTAAVWSPQPLMVGEGTERRTAFAAFGTHDLLDMLGVGVPLGRDFTPSDDRRGAEPVALLSDRYWRNAFDGSPDVVGRTMMVAGKTVTIVGVAAPRFRGLSLARAADFFMPLHVIDQVGFPGTNYFADRPHVSSPTAGLTIVGRLHDGDGGVQAASRIAALVSRRSATGTREVGLIPINIAAIPVAARAGLQQFAKLLAATVGLMLLIGCATVGMLLLVRTEARREELALCIALGASRARLARGIALEGALLSTAGAVLAPPVAWWLFKAIRVVQMPGVTIDLLDLPIDVTALAVVSGAAIMASLLLAGAAGAFGLNAREEDALRARAGATPRVSRRKTRALLVAAQVAIAMVLVTGAGLFVRSLREALHLNPRIDSARLVAGDVSLGAYGYTPLRAQTFFDDLRQRLAGNPAIGSLGFSASGWGMGAGGKLTIDGTARQMSAFVGFVGIDEGYLDTVGLRVAPGRPFSTTDAANAPRVGIVSESFARFLASDGGPVLGRRITMPFSRPPAPPPVVQVVGVVPDVITNVVTLEPMVLYLPLAQTDPSANRTIVCRPGSTVDAATREVSRAIRGMEPAIKTFAMTTLDDQLLRQMGPQKFAGTVLGSLGIIAVLLTLLGTYVLAESMAVLRLREMGVRAAIGATRAQLASIVIAETARLVGIGLAVGFVVAWLGASTIRAFLFRVQPLDPATLAAVGSVIFAFALAVSLRPALRAARVDVAQVLRQE